MKVKLHQYSQRHAILDWLKRRPITAMEALDALGCFRLASRINEIKRDHVIKRKMIPVVNRDGKTVRVAQYTYGGKK